MNHCRLYSVVLTLSLALGRIAALATCGFLQVIGFGAAAAAQCVRLIATLPERRRSLRLEEERNSSAPGSWTSLTLTLTYSIPLFNDQQAYT